MVLLSAWEGKKLSARGEVHGTHLPFAACLGRILDDDNGFEVMAT